MSGASPNTTSAPPPRWRFWIDTGGTFTDCIALDPAGAVRRVKVLSSGRARCRVTTVHDASRASLSFPTAVPEGFLRGLELRALGGGAGARVVDSAATRAAATEVTLERPLLDTTWLERPVEIAFPEEAPVVAMRLITGVPPGGALPPLELRLATTRGTNALLERKGSRVVLFVTQGFGDLITIGTQARPDLFALDIEKPAPLYERVVEVRERLDAAGEVLEPPNLAAVLAAGRRLVGEGFVSAAVALLHSYRDQCHEQAVADVLAGAGFAHVAVSAAMAPVIRILPRAETAIVDAYLGPIIRGYLGSIRRSIDEGGNGGGEANGGHQRRVLVMTSAGGLVPDRECLAKDCLLSGPAGGVVGAAAAAAAAGRHVVLTFDMGGTSTDVARFAGELEYVFEHRVGDAQVMSPALHVETVAAGGGSVCWWSGGLLKVGPHSAGAEPGPACYGAGGPLTVTDVNLLLGRLDPQRFEVPLAPPAAEAAALEAARAVGVEPSRVPEMLEGFLRIANERMAEAIRRVSVQRGYDPAEHALLAFGGAGAQHACAIADSLGIAEVLVPGDASLLSAAGLGRAVVERFAHRQVLEPLAALGAGGRLEALIESAAAEAVDAVRRDAAGEVMVRRRIARLRFAGQESTLDLECDETADVFALADRFRARYQETFGTLPSREVELESLRVVAAAVADEPPVSLASGPASAAADRPARFTTAWFGGRRIEVPIWERDTHRPGFVAAGPALVVEQRSCTVVEPGWSATWHPSGALVLSRARGAARQETETSRPTSATESSPLA